MATSSKVAFSEEVKRVREFLGKYAEELDPGCRLYFRNTGFQVDMVVDSATGERLYCSPDHVEYSNLCDLRNNPQAIKALLRNWGAGKSKNLSRPTTVE